MKSMEERQFVSIGGRRYDQYRIHDKHSIFYQDVHVCPSQKATPAM
ncbi:hypothetical protein [Bacillus amyloliquefaciens]|nr:hypothetical protein [Bacillus amyloliquefaciens]